jgi:hypothetical protein
MTPRLALTFAALAIVSAAPAPLVTPKVAELQGRTPGKPQRCVALPPGQAFSTADSDPLVLLYDDGKTVWASRLDAGCGFGPGESIIPDSPASYYCHGDFIRQGGRIELNPFGARCTLGDFVPYKNAK